MMRSFVSGKSKINVWHQSDLDLIKIWASVLSEICKSVGILGNIQKEFCSVWSLFLCFFLFFSLFTLSLFFFLIAFMSLDLLLCLFPTLYLLLFSFLYFSYYFVLPFFLLWDLIVCFLLCAPWYFSFCQFLFVSFSCWFLVFFVVDLYFFLYFLHTHTHHAIAQFIEKCWCRITVCGNSLCVVCV